MADRAIVIQNFNKPDTLKAVCESLLTCDNRHQFDLIFWSDSVIGARKEIEYAPMAQAVRDLLRSFTADHGHQFRSISLRGNTSNLGCYKTCETAIDSAFEDHDFVIFAEDDGIFSPDALNWFTGMRNDPAFLDDAVWAIAGESIFFDGQHKTADSGLVAAAKTHAIKYHLWNKFIPLGFIPSTCFATSRAKWSQFSVTRSGINGDVTLCDRCRDERKTCLFPVVARVKDIGMLHPDGYSVSVHTEQNVTGVKNCYLMSGDIRPDHNVLLEPALFTGDPNLLYWQSALLNGFDPTTDPNSTTTLDAARRACANGEWEAALNLYRALKNDGLDTIEVMTNLGLCHLKRGEVQHARSAIQLVLSRQPDEAYAQSIMAYIHEATGDTAPAWAIWRALVQRNGIADWLHANAVDGERRCAPPR